MAERVAQRVLVVDDDNAVARMLRVTLITEGFDVSLARHGEEALTQAELFEPALVVLDLQMPIMDGRTFFKEYRRRGFRSPVVILSAYDPEAARRELGADAALQKPCDPRDISRTISDLLAD